MLVLLNHGGDYLTNAALQFAVVSNRRAHGNVGGIDRRNAEGNQLGSIDQESSGNAFFQTMAAEVPHFLSDQHEVAGRAFIYSTLTRHNLSLQLGWRIIKLYSNEPLPGRLFQIFQD